VIPQCQPPSCSKTCSDGEKPGSFTEDKFMTCLTLPNIRSNTDFDQCRRYFVATQQKIVNPCRCTPETFRNAYTDPTPFTMPALQSRTNRSCLLKQPASVMAPAVAHDSPRTTGFAAGRVLRPFASNNHR
jgi:hypothetical protein